MVQVCIDSPASVHEQEVAFWRALLSGRWVAPADEEFAGKWHDDAGSPLQLLFQRLDEPRGSVRAHLDHGTTTAPRRSADSWPWARRTSHPVGAGMSYAT